MLLLSNESFCSFTINHFYCLSIYCVIYNIKYYLLIIILLKEDDLIAQRVNLVKNNAEGEGININTVRFMNAGSDCFPSFQQADPVP